MNVLSNYIIEYYLYIELIPVLAGIVRYKKLEKIYKTFVWVLLFTFLIEVFKIYYGTYIHVGYNRIWTNVYNIIYFSFLFWVFYQKTKSELFKTIIKVISVLYFVSIGYELIIQNANYHYTNQVIPFIIGGFGIIACVFNYLYGVMKSSVIENIFKDFLFWFVAAHFIYFLGIYAL